MLKVINQNIISGRYIMELSDGRKIGLNNTNPSSGDINVLLIDYERQLLNEIDAGGEEQEEYSTIVESIGII